MSTKDIIQDALDDLASTKSSTARQGRALDKLERLVAEICVTAGTGSTEALQSFVALQDTFECNVPFRLLVWISSCLSVLSVLSSKSSTTNHDAELTIISTQIAQALSIIQGTALIHAGSKRYLGRRYPLEVLVDLFYSSRRAPPVPTSVSTNLSVPSPTSMYSKRSKDSTATSIPLANIVLDTLLCILVDAPSALRVFESVNGVHTLVKMFKRAATPREVRMRCIEFLYFYLMDENPLNQPPQDLQTHSHSHSHSHSSSLSSTSDIPQIPTAPNSPVHTPSQHRHGSALSVSQMSDSSVSSVDSYVTSSTTASNSTKATSVSSRSSSLAPSPQIVDQTQQQHQPRQGHTRSGSAQPRPLSLIRAEEQLKPLSAKHVQAKLGVGTPRQPPSNANREKLRRIDTNMTSSTSTSASEVERDNSTSTSLASRLEDLHLELPTPRQQLAPRLQSNSLSQITPTTPNPHSGSAQRPLGHRRAQSTIEVSSTSSSMMMGTPAMLKTLARSTSPPMSAVPPSPADSLMGSRSGQGERGERGEKGEKGDRMMPPPSGVKSMAEKKAFLGTMLGNVDALVESIQKAGILGLI